MTAEEVHQAEVDAAMAESRRIVARAGPPGPARSFRPCAECLTRGGAVHLVAAGEKCGTCGAVSDVALTRAEIFACLGRRS